MAPPSLPLLPSSVRQLLQPCELLAGSSLRSISVVSSDSHESLEAEPSQAAGWPLPHQLATFNGFPR